MSGVSGDGMDPGVLEHVKRTGADLTVAEQAVRAAAGLPARPPA